MPEQNGVSPASADRASAPDPATVDNSIAYALTHHYGFLPLSVRYGAAAAARAAVENWTRPRPVPDAEILPADRESGPRDAEPGQLREIANTLHVLLGEADCIAPGGGSMEHVRYLLRLVEGHLDAISDRNRPKPPQSDPRDAEIERLRRELDALTLGASAAGRVREALAKERDEAREEWKRADAEVTRLADELRAIRHKLAVELNLKPSELDGRETTDLAVELIDRRGKSVIYWKGLAERRGRQLDQRDKDGRQLIAERDRLRAELDLIGEQRPKFQPGQRVRVGLCDGIVVTPKNLTRVQFEGMLHTFDIPTRDVHAIDDTAPAEPRRWVAGDAEPEVGTTVRNRQDGLVMIRRADGWHYEDCGENCDSTGDLQWTEMLNGTELVEVVSTDG